MGLMKGSVSISRFKVEGNLPDNFWDWVNKKVTQNVFMDIEGVASEKSLGWVSAHDYFDVGFAFESYNLNPYLVLGIRQDKRTVNASLVRKYHRLEIIKARSLHPEVKLSKPDREMLKEKARLELLTRIPPQTRTWEMCWHTVKGELWFTTTSQATLELSRELFLKSFGPLTLTPRLPYLLADEFLPAEQKSALAHLTPLI